MPLGLARVFADFGAIPDSARVVRDGSIITGGSVTAGIDFALVLIAESVGEERAQSVQLALEYAPEPPLRRRRPDTAPSKLYRNLEIRFALGKPAQRAVMEGCSRYA